MGHISLPATPRRPITLPGKRAVAEADFATHLALDGRVNTETKPAAPRSEPLRRRLAQEKGNWLRATARSAAPPGIGSAAIYASRAENLLRIAQERASGKRRRHCCWSPRT